VAYLVLIPTGVMIFIIGWLAMGFLKKLDSELLDK
jgi:hypothetical protein